MRPKKELTLEQIQKNKKLLFTKARELVMLHQLCSIPMLQRHFQIPYAESKAIIEKLMLDEEIKPFVYTPPPRPVVKYEKKVRIKWRLPT